MRAVTQTLFFGVVLLACCAVCWGQGSASSVAATLCDLYQHPEQYAGKMVKVRGGSVGELHIEDALHDSQAVPCPAYMRIIVVFPDQLKDAPDFQLVRDESYRKLLDALHHPSPVHIDATYEGRFDPVFVWRDHKRFSVGQGNKKGYGEKHQYDGRIVLHQVSEVWVNPIPRR
jgi:hypothetical protein